MTDQVKNTEKPKNEGAAEYQRLKAEAKKIGIDCERMNKEEIILAIQRKQIQDTERIRIEEREKLMQEQRMRQQRAEIIAESESLAIPIDLPDPCTELDLAKARRTLGLKKKQVKPSPETIAIEAGKKGYYVFRNLMQDDLDISCCPGGKHHLDLIPGEIHVLSDYHVKFFKSRAVEPTYGRVPRQDGRGEDTTRTGSKPRFMFELIEEAPIDAPFGLVTDESIKKKLLEPV